MLKYDISQQNDEVDNKIIAELAKDCKISCKILSQRVNLSVPRVYERVRRLEDNKIISGYCATINFKQLGYQIHTFILIKPDKFVGSIFTKLKTLDFVYDVWVVSGEFHYMLEVYTQNMDQLCALTDYLYNNIGRTHTLFIMEH